MACRVCPCVCRNGAHVLRMWCSCVLCVFLCLPCEFLWVSVCFCVLSFTPPGAPAPFATPTGAPGSSATPLVSHCLALLRIVSRCSCVCVLVGDLDGHLWLKHAIGFVCASPLAFPRCRAAACPFQRCHRGGARTTDGEVVAPMRCQSTMEWCQNSTETMRQALLAASPRSSHRSRRPHPLLFLLLRGGISETGKRPRGSGGTQEGMRRRILSHA
jgi:hypothetical protein